MDDVIDRETSRKAVARRPRREILVPAPPRDRSRERKINQELLSAWRPPASGGPSLEVDTLATCRSPRTCNSPRGIGTTTCRCGRTVAPHGMTGPEIKRLSGAVRFMGLHCSPRHGIRLWWATTDKRSSRSTIADVQKRITKLQGKHRFLPYSVTVFETSPALHAHIVFIGNAEIAQHLKGSSAFGAIINVDPVPDPDGLVRKYLVKERTPQAGYHRGHRLGGRLKGSHRLEGGGDRVRLARDLERDALEAGAVECWQHTNAKRSAERKAYRLRRLPPRKAPRPAGQLPLLPEIARPVTRLREFGGGIVPPAVALEIEFLRRQCGWSQRQLGNKISRSQGQIANALRGHDPISSLAVNRLRRFCSEETRKSRKAWKVESNGWWETMDGGKPAPKFRGEACLPQKTT